jgi:hypothetical protein
VIVPFAALFRQRTWRHTRALLVVATILFCFFAGLLATADLIHDSQGSAEQP